ncbi:MAG: TRAP transporter small permease [Lautropia sp.]|nr:TRAP transporter small permease [Lautropia sp.]
MDENLPDAPMDRARGGARVIEILLDAIGILVLLALAAITTVDVMGRYLFNAPLRGAFESSELLLAVLVFSALPRVTWHRQHLMVSLIDGVLAPRGLRIQRALVGLVTGLALGVLAVFLWMHATQLAEYGDMSNALQLPIAPFAFAASILTGLSAVAALLRVWCHDESPAEPVPAAVPAGNHEEG